MALGPDKDSFRRRCRISQTAQIQTVPSTFIAKMSAQGRSARHLTRAKAESFPVNPGGSDLEFNIGEQAMKCPYCGHVKEIERRPDGELQEQDFHAMLERIRQWRDEAQTKKLETDSDAAAAEVWSTESCVAIPAAAMLSSMAH